MSIGCRHGGCVWGLHALSLSTPDVAFEWPFTCSSFFLLLQAFHCLNLITFEALSAKCVHDNNVLGLPLMSFGTNIGSK